MPYLRVSSDAGVQIVVNLSSQEEGVCLAHAVHGSAMGVGVFARVAVSLLYITRYKHKVIIYLAVNHLTSSPLCSYTH